MLLVLFPKRVQNFKKSAGVICKRFQTCPMDIIPYCDLKVNRISADFYSKVKIAEIHSCDSSKNRTLRKRRLCSVIPYFFVYCDAESERRNIQNGLDYLAEERYNPNAPGDRGRTPRIHGSIFHTTTWLTTTAFGGCGDSGEKSAGEQVFRTKQRLM